MIRCPAAQHPCLACPRLHATRRGPLTECAAQCQQRLPAPTSARQVGWADGDWAPALPACGWRRQSHNCRINLQVQPESNELAGCTVRFLNFVGHDQQQCEVSCRHQRAGGRAGGQACGTLVLSNGPACAPLQIKMALMGGLRYSNLGPRVTHVLAGAPALGAHAAAARRKSAALTA